MAESSQADFIVMKARSPSLSDRGAQRAAVNRQYKRSTGWPHSPLMNKQAPLDVSLRLAPAHLSLVQTILADHLPQARVLIFGSRAGGTPRKYSDLDPAIIQPEPLTLRTISRLKIAF